MFSKFYLSFLGFALTTALFTSHSWASGFIEKWELEVGTEVPFQLGVRTKANFNSKYYGVAGLGYSMGFLQSASSSVVGGVGLVGKNTMTLFTESISNSLVVDLRGGWNYGGEHGIFFEAGYLYLAGGSGTADVKTLNDAVGTDYCQGLCSILETESADVKSSMHALTAHTGYRWELGNFLLTADLGVIKPVAGSFDLQFQNRFISPSSQAQRLETEAESYMDSAFLSKIFIPTISVWVAYNW